MQEVVMKVWGRMACFSMPEYAVERFTYPVLTPSAANCILGSVYVKRAEFDWDVTKIKMLKPIQMFTMRTNEIKNMPTPLKDKWGPFSLTDKNNRTQRYTTVLVDVAYIIHAHPVRSWIRSENSVVKGPQVHQSKHINIFNCQLKKGACFYRPYLGMRQFPAFFGPPEPDDKPLPIDMDLGVMPKKVQYAKWDLPTRFFQASLEKGVLTVPRG
jgi:CRISPR-associated protein Cas5d